MSLAFALADTLGCADAVAHALHVGAPEGTPIVAVDARHEPRLRRVIGEGGVVEAVVDAAGRVDADLIVMATRGHDTLLDALRGSTTEQVLRPPAGVAGRAGGVIGPGASTPRIDLEPRRPTMRMKQLLLAAALVAVTAAGGARAQEAAPSDQHQQHHPVQAAMPDQSGAEDAGAAMAGQGAGAAQPPAGSAPGMSMMGPGMMRMMGGGTPMAGGATMAQGPAPGVTIIINMQGMPMMHGPMMGAQVGGQGTPGMTGTGGQGASAMPGMGTGTGTAAPGAAQGPATQAYAEAMARMHRDMGMMFSGDADVDFARAG